jgi:hypothetical protein
MKTRDSAGHRQRSHTAWRQPAFPSLQHLECCCTAACGACVLSHCRPPGHQHHPASGQWQCCAPCYVDDLHVRAHRAQ